jgi:hypothetical protein
MDFREGGSRLPTKPSLPRADGYSDSAVFVLGIAFEAGSIDFDAR